MSDFMATDQTLAGAPAEPLAGGRGLRQRLRHRKGSIIGLIGLGLVAVIAILAPLLAPHNPLEQNLGKSLRPPFWVEGGAIENPLGTDALGRDVASRLIHGARNSLLISLMAALISSLLGLITGLIAGFFGKWVDSLLMRLGDIQLAFPFVLLAIAFLGTSANRTPLHLILVLGLPGWAVYARVVRSRVLAEREKDYVTAAKALGAKAPRRLWRYVLPNVWQVVPVIAMLDLGFLVIVESMLSFLGFGLTPPTPSWGSILAEGKQYMIVTPWLSVLPGLAIIFTVLSINLTADGLADLIDPKLARGSFRRYSLSWPARPEHSDSRELPLLRVRNLVTEFPLEDRVIRAVRGISFEVKRGQAVGIVGESGSGKSVTALSIIQLLDSPGRVTAGEILFDGRDLARLDDKAMAALRGRRIGMIFQNPGASLNPVLTIGSQMSETFRRHRQISPAEALKLARETLLAVGIGDPARVLRAYPFQLSGGMNQRVMIAMVMALQPDLLIADEPTTALDVTTQAQILERLREIIRRYHTSFILITHDIALLAGFVDTIIVMYAGQICEIGSTQAIIDSPRHPYTQALLNSVPRAEIAAGTELTAIPGDPPDPATIPPGCPFASRCPEVMDICRQVNPPRLSVGPGQEAACHLYTAEANKMKKEKVGHGISA
jgi:peptide/nickel transport system permease protein